MKSDSPNLSRRQLLRGRLPRGLLEGVLPESAAPSTKTPPQAKPATQTVPRGGRTFPLIRPPGAVDEALFLECCTKCDKCAQACPHDAIAKAPIRFRGAEGTPVIDPAKSPCRMCEDMPCIAACPEQALVFETLGPIASARILDYNCLAHQGGFCIVCYEQCPTPDAITVAEGRPHINSDACTGCGICHYACPAPTNAIAVMPLQDRPLPPPPATTP